MQQLIVGMSESGAEPLNHLIDRHAVDGNDLSANRLRVLRRGGGDKESVIEPKKSEREESVVERDSGRETGMHVAGHRYQLRQSNIELRIGGGFNLGAQARNCALIYGGVQLVVEVFVQLRELFGDVIKVLLPACGR